MSPLVILIIALTVVIGGVLFLRLHAFLVLIVGALVVGALTPTAAIRRFELGKAEIRIESVAADGRTGQVSDRKRQVADGSRMLAYRIEAGGEPKRIGEVGVVVSVGAGSAGRRVEAELIGREGEESLRSGDYLVTAGAVGAAEKIAGQALGQRVAEGFGRTALNIGILIAMASILGTCLMAARGAERIVVSLQNAIGVHRTPLAFLGSGFLLGIPMFAEAVFYLLLPLAKAMWAKTRSHYVLYVLAIVAGATMTHSLIPPTPGPLFVANELGVGLSVMMLQGAIVGGIAALSGYGYAVWADRRWSIPLRDPAVVEAVQADGGNAKASPAKSGRSTERAGLPPLIPSLLPVLLPVVLISAASILESNPGVGLPGWLRSAIEVLGDKNLALTVSAGMAILLLAVRQRNNPEGTRKAIRSAIVEGGEIILVIAAGGALGHTLRQAGMAELASAAVPAWKLALLPMAWGITAVIRIAQGSATVAMITAVGIVGPFAVSAGLGYHPVYLAVAIGCGSKIGMWMNDSGFWVISKMSGMTEAETLKTASAMVFIEGTVGLAATMMLASVWPMT
ncbi:MAG: GntP family permease [Limisphaerales bacterium]